MSSLNNFWVANCIEVPFVLEDAEQPLTTTARSFIADLYDELIVHDKQIERQELAL